MLHEKQTWHSLGKKTGKKFKENGLGLAETLNQAYTYFLFLKSEVNAVHKFWPFWPPSSRHIIIVIPS